MPSIDCQAGVAPKPALHYYHPKSWKYGQLKAWGFMRGGMQDDAMVAIVRSLWNNDTLPSATRKAVNELSLLSDDSAGADHADISSNGKMRKT